VIYVVWLCTVVELHEADEENPVGSLHGGTVGYMEKHDRTYFTTADTPTPTTEKPTNHDADATEVALPYPTTNPKP